ncbi:MAG: hypothetical protein RRY15_08265, partial [Bacteroidales bacterium]
GQNKKIAPHQIIFPKILQTGLPSTFYALFKAHTPSCFGLSLSGEVLVYVASNAIKRRASKGVLRW